MDTIIKGDRGPDVLFMEKISYELTVLQTLGGNADKLTV